MQKIFIGWNKMDKRTDFMNTFVDCLTMDETIEEIILAIKEKKCVHNVGINADKINLMQKDEKLVKIINSSEIINADGVSIVLAGKFLGKNIPERVAGIDVVDKLIEICARENFKPYFFGTKQHILEKMIDHYRTLYPELKIAGYRSGYFEDSESISIAENIRQSQADIVFVGFPSPQKEYWIDKYMKYMNVPIALGVGGSFDVISGELKRAPKWMQKSGLEWFYRFLQEPRRLFKRYLVGNFKFCLMVVKARFKN